MHSKKCSKYDRRGRYVAFPALESIPTSVTTLSCYSELRVNIVHHTCLVGTCHPNTTSSSYTHPHSSRPFKQHHKLLQTISQLHRTTVTRFLTYWSTSAITRLEICHSHAQDSPVSRRKGRCPMSASAQMVQMKIHQRYWQR